MSSYQDVNLKKNVQALEPNSPDKVLEFADLVRWLYSPCVAGAASHKDDNYHTHAKGQRYEKWIKNIENFKDDT